MKITEVKIHQPVGFLRLITDEGLEGWCCGVSPEQGHLIHKYLIDAAVGSSPFDRERVWNAMVDRTTAAHLGSTIWAPLDVAMWDLLGKALELPIYRVIGGFRDRAPACLSGRRHIAPEEKAEEALFARENGYHGYRMCIGSDPTVAVRTATVIRQRIGDDYTLMAWGDTSLQHAHALTVGRALDDLGFLGFEDPFPISDTRGLSALSDALDIPVHCTVMGIDSLSRSTQLLSAQAVDGLRIAFPRTGGLTDACKIARVAESFGVNCEADDSEPSAEFTRAHFLGTVKNSMYFAVPADSATGNRNAPDQATFIVNRPSVKDGYIQIPAGAGLGMDLDARELARQTESIEK